MSSKFVVTCLAVAYIAAFSLAAVLSPTPAFSKGKTLSAKECILKIFNKYCARDSQGKSVVGCRLQPEFIDSEAKKMCPSAKVKINK